MKKELISNEHPENANAKDKKYFYPRLLTAIEWSKDSLQETLQKVQNMRRERTLNSLMEQCLLATLLLLLSVSSLWHSLK